MPSRPFRPHHMRTIRPGITLVEMLVALAVTLIMMGAVITVFGFIGERVSDSRSMIETNDRLRSATHRLREDLSSITVDVVPWQRPEAGQGYLEILEGPERDYRRDPATGASNGPNSIFGDWDDVLFTTIRTKGDPFRGKFGATSIESNTAEVVWYLRDADPNIRTNPGTYTLCRRLLLIVPQADLDAAIASLPAQDRQRMAREWFYHYFDVSARVESPSGPRIANTLGDLTKRENRFGHNRWDANGNLAFPFFVRLNQADPSASNVRIYPHVRAPYDASREGEEVVLTNVLSFNIQVYDPTAPLRQNAGAVVAPGEPGYLAGTAASLPLGAYIDLGERIPGATFGFLDPASAVGRRSLLAPTVNNPYSTYDTWSFHYEHDGIRQPTHLVQEMPRDWRQGTGPADPGTNGIDDNDLIKMDGGGAPSPGVDDITERETSPPYPHPLRGLRATIRVYEPTSKQVREVTVVESFVPE